MTESGIPSETAGGADELPAPKLAAPERGRALYRQGRSAEAVAAFDEALAGLEPRDPGWAELRFLRGMAHLQAGDGAEATDDLEEAAAAGWLEARFQLALIYARQGRRRGALRERAIAHLERILEEPAGRGLAAGLDRVGFALGGLYGEGDAEADLTRAVEACRKGLEVNPLSAAGHSQVGQLLLRAGQPLRAVGEFKVALQLDPEYRAAHASLARLFFKHIKPADLADEYAHIVAEFGDRAPQVLARLSQELVELGREQVYRSLYTKGHQLKNLIGLLGSRLRRAQRALDGQDLAAARSELAQVAGEHEGLYDEWVGYLSAMTPDQLTTSLVEPARIARRVTAALDSAGERLRLRVQEGVPRIAADERLVREALTNLCVNALEAIDGVEPAGHAVLGVGFDAGTGMVFLEVEDTGPGIPPERLEHVFDPGYTTKTHGNGYGLAIARRIAQAHHGDLRVKSRVGHGTVFRLDLPVDFDADSDAVGDAGGLVDSLAGSVL